MNDIHKDKLRPVFEALDELSPSPPILNTQPGDAARGARRPLTAVVLTFGLVLSLGAVVLLIGTGDTSRPEPAATAAPLGSASSPSTLAPTVGPPATRSPMTAAASEGLSGTWSLVRGVIDDEEIAPFPDAPITLVIADQRVTGRSGCNRHSGGYRILNRVWRSGGDLFSTAAACSPEEIMTIEDTYLTALDRVDDYTIEGDLLTLRGSEVVLEYDRAR